MTPGVPVEVVWAGPDGALGTADDVPFRTTTGADGRWSVAGLPAGPLRVALDLQTLPLGTALGSEPDAVDALVADGVLLTTLAAGASDRSLDFGLRGTGTVGDRVWLDRDADGVQDADEPGLPGVAVTVRWPGSDARAGTDDDLVVTVTTGADGAWTVPGLPAGQLALVLDPRTLPAGTRPVTDPGQDPADEADGRASTALDPGEDDRTLDFGLNGTGTLGDLVWLDHDGDGTVDGDEPALAGVGVDVDWSGPDGVLGTPDDVRYRATTDASGRWRVTGLVAGPFVVRLDASTFPPGTAVVADPEGDVDGTATGQLAAGASDLSLDFGLRGTGSLGDLVWLDRDADGTRGEAEPGLSGVAVEVTWPGRDGVLDTDDDLRVSTTTSATGAWRVAGLPAGDHRVRLDPETLPAGTEPASDPDGQRG
ncbi:SdrD B-like domain-containing protein, partial [Microlunatus capsulatus]|uniref:SdrD B-like domain-containing protein n=1 Tax=Microlunatus capsulatus TaxID=99117 RepID=UPI0031E19B2C